MLSNPLEATQGIENIILDLGKKIGVFDLAGQQNQRWLESEKNEIFQKSDIIIIVIDIEPYIERNQVQIKPLLRQISYFLNKIIEIQDKYNFFPVIYLLIHKIDLLGLDLNKLKSLQNQIINHLVKGDIGSISKEVFISLALTSINKKYFFNTLVIFIDILKTYISELKSTDLGFDIIETVMNTLFQNEAFLNVKNGKIISLNEVGKEKLNAILNEYYKVNIRSIEKEILELTLPEEVKNNPIFGFLIFAKKDNMFLKKIELFEGLFNEFLNIRKEDFLVYLMTVVDGISKEMHIMPSSIILKEKYFNIFYLNFTQFTVFLFTLSSVNIKLIENIINSSFKKLFKHDAFVAYQENFNIAQINALENEMQRLLRELNSLYNKINFIIVNLFSQINEKININFSHSPKIIKKLNSLKLNLLKAVIDEDFKKIELINRILEEIIN